MVVNRTYIDPAEGSRRRGSGYVTLKRRCGAVEGMVWPEVERRITMTVQQARLGGA